jgi:hypothetical protein
LYNAIAASHTTLSQRPFDVYNRPHKTEIKKQKSHVIRKSSFSQRSLEISQAPLFSVSGQPISCNELYYKQLGGRKTTTRCNTLFALFPIASSASHGEPVTFLLPCGDAGEINFIPKKSINSLRPRLLPFVHLWHPVNAMAVKGHQNLFFIHNHLTSRQRNKLSLLQPIDATLLPIFRSQASTVAWSHLHLHIG